MAVIVGLLFIGLGAVAIKYGVSAIIVGLTFLAIACGIKRS